MDKLKFGLFDIFVYMIPGTLLLFSLYLTTIDLTKGMFPNITSITKIVNEVSFNVILLIALIAYVLGFAFHYLGYVFFNNVGKRIWKKKLFGKEESLWTHEQQFVLVRHYSKENFAFVEQWYTFRAMSFNLSLVFLLISLITLTKMIINIWFKLDWILMTIGCLFLSLILLRRAITFHLWSYNTLTQTVSSLGLLNKNSLTQDESTSTNKSIAATNT